MRRIRLTFILAIWAIYPLYALAQHDCLMFQDRQERARALVLQDTAALKKLGLQTNVNALESWAGLTNEQKSKLEQTAIFNFIAVATAVPFLPATSGKVTLPNGLASLGTAQAQSVYHWLDQKGIQSPILEKLIEGASQLVGKRETSELGQKILDVVSTSVQSGMALNGANKIEVVVPAAQLGMVLLTTVKPALAGYAAALGAGADVFTLIQAAAEFITADDQIQYLTSLNEADLKSLNRLSSQLRDHVQNLQTANKDLQSCLNPDNVDRPISLIGEWKVVTSAQSAPVNNGDKVIIQRQGNGFDVLLTGSNIHSLATGTEKQIRFRVEVTKVRNVPLNIWHEAVLRFPQCRDWFVALVLSDDGMQADFGAGACLVSWRNNEFTSVDRFPEANIFAHLLCPSCAQKKWLCISSCPHDRGARKQISETFRNARVEATSRCNSFVGTTFAGRSNRRIVSSFKT